jgi:hypothetical protein
MSLSEKAQIYYNVWCCAYRRRSLYQGTPRAEREHTTILMCLNMKDAKWTFFDSEKPQYLK